MNRILPSNLTKPIGYFGTGSVEMIGFVRIWMVLWQKAWPYLEVEQSACVEVDGEVEGVDSVPDGDGFAALRVVGVALDVHDAVKELVRDGDDDADAVGQTVDDNVGAREVGDNHGGRGQGDADARTERVLPEAFDAPAQAPVVDGGAVSVGSARPLDARVGARQVSRLAVLGRVTVGVHSALGN